MRSVRFLPAFGLAAVLLSSSAHARAQEPGAANEGFSVTLRTHEDAVYQKGPMVLTMVFVNKGTTPVTLDAAAFAPERFRIVDEKGKAPGKVQTGAPAPESLRIDGLETLERAIDMSAWYTGLTTKLRVWEITWSQGDLKAEPLVVRITPPYDPKKDNKAIVETDLGTMVWRLMPEHAPNHVKHFVALARQGFYDGLSIYRAAPGLTAEGGDPMGDGTGGWDRLQPPEMSKSVEMKMGLVGSLRKESSVTNDYVFFITLGPNEYMAGLQTFFAEVISGIEVLAKLHRVPSRGGEDVQPYLLTPPVKIHRIAISR